MISGLFREIVEDDYRIRRRNNCKLGRFGDGALNYRNLKDAVQERSAESPFIMLTTSVT